MTTKMQRQRRRSAAGERRRRREAPGPALVAMKGVAKRSRSCHLRRIHSLPAIPSSSKGKEEVATTRRPRTTRRVPITTMGTTAGARASSRGGTRYRKARSIPSRSIRCSNCPIRPSPSLRRPRTTSCRSGRYRRRRSVDWPWA